MKENKKNIEIIIAICMITVFMGQIYINPFSIWFRLSLAVITLSILLVYFKNISVVFVCNIVAILMFLFRSFVHFITFQDMTFQETLSNYLPVIIFYILFGVLFEMLHIRKNVDKPVTFIISLWMCDSLSNIAEVFFRSFKTTFFFDEVVLSIILMGLFRSLLTYFIYYICIYYKHRYDREQKEIKYREMVLFISSLKSELFF